MVSKSIGIVLFEVGGSLKKSLVSISKKLDCGCVDITVCCPKKNPLIDSFNRSGKLSIDHTKAFSPTDISGDYICFIDDRTLFSENWLQELYRLIETDLDVGVIFGKVVPVSRINTPKWFPTKAEMLFSRTELGEKKQFFRDRYRVCIPNIVLRKEYLDRLIKPLDPKNYINQLDKLIDKLYNTGTKIIYSSEIFSYYFVKDENKTLFYVLKKFFSIGFLDGLYGMLKVDLSIRLFFSILFKIFSRFLKKRSSSRAEFLRIYFYKLGCFFGRCTKKVFFFFRFS